MSDKPLPSFSKRLKELRESKEMTLQELATVAGLSISLVTQIEMGRRTNPRVSTLSALADALGVDAADLLRAIVDQPPKKKKGK